MQLVFLLGVYSIFFSTAAEGINGKGGSIKDTSLSGLAQTDLLRIAMVCTVVGTLV